MPFYHIVHGDRERVSERKQARKELSKNTWIRKETENPEALYFRFKSASCIHILVNKNSQRGVEEKKLSSGETVYKLGKHSLQWQLNVYFTETERKLSFIETVLAQVYNWSNFMQMRFQNSYCSKWFKSCSSDWSISMQMRI